MRFHAPLSGESPLDEHPVDVDLIRLSEPTSQAVRTNSLRGYHHNALLWGYPYFVYCGNIPTVKV